MSRRVLTHNSQQKCWQGPGRRGSHDNAVGLLVNDIIETKFIENDIIETIHHPTLVRFPSY